MRRTLLFSLMCLAVFVAKAEGGLWYGIDATHDFNKRLSAEFSLGSRVEDGWSRYTRYDLAASVSWKALSWLKIGGGYDFIRDYNAEEIVTKYKDDNPANRVTGFNVDEAFWRTKHRLFADVTGKWRAGRFTFALRERYQYTRFTPVDGLREWKYRYFREYESPAEIERPYIPYTMADGTVRYFELDESRTDYEEKSAKDRHYLRSRFGVEYNIRHCPFTPFATYEVSNNLGKRLQLVRQRLQVGGDYKVKKGHTVTMAYLYQHGENEDNGDANLHVLSVGYKFKF